MQARIMTIDEFEALVKSHKWPDAGVVNNCDTSDNKAVDLCDEISDLVSSVDISASQKMTALGVVAGELLASADDEERDRYDLLEDFDNAIRNGFDEFVDGECVPFPGDEREADLETKLTFNGALKAGKATSCAIAPYVCVFGRTWASTAIAFGAWMGAITHELSEEDATMFHKLADLAFDISLKNKSGVLDNSIWDEGIAT